MRKELQMLRYPWDAEEIFAHKKKLKKLFLEKLEIEPQSFINLKIAILSDDTIGQFKDILELFLLDKGIMPVFYVGNYGNLVHDSIFGLDLKNFSPDLVYIHTTLRYIKNLEEFKTEDIMNVIGEIWGSLRANFSCPIIQNNFENPNFYDESIINKVAALNESVKEQSKIGEGFYLNNINFLANCYGLNKWYDEQLWFQYKYPFALNAFPLVCSSISNIIQSIMGKEKKLIILDLDNTLWGGIIGEEGVENIQLGVETGIGMAYSKFQKYLKTLSNNGILLAISSKNNKDIALMGFSHKSSILQQNDFVSLKINWNEKSTNIQDILDEINILEESTVFIDDNIFECELVKNCFPKMEVLHLDNIENIIDRIIFDGYFYKLNISVEDVNRKNYYLQNRIRETQRKEFSNYFDYLKSLNMICKIQKVDHSNIERCIQLINKTNQFNLTAKRLTKEELERLLTYDFVAFAISLEDRFGDNGIVSVLLLEKKNDIIEIPLWVMSCRVFKRKLEYSIFEFLKVYCKKSKIQSIKGYYFKTVKNNYVEDLYTNLGFNEISNNEYVYNIENRIKPYSNLMEVVEEYE